MDTVIKNYLEQMKVGRKQSCKNLALFPLLSTYTVSLEHLMLDVALGNRGNGHKSAFGIKYIY